MYFYVDPVFTTCTTLVFNKGIISDLIWDCTFMPYSTVCSIYSSTMLIYKVQISGDIYQNPITSYWNFEFKQSV